MVENKVEISASIMCINWLNVGADLEVLEKHGIDYLHWDIIDGTFASDFTMGSSIINKIKSKSKMRSDYHLMVVEPSRVFQTFDISKDDVLTIHQEASRNLHRDLVSIRRLGARVGVAISPGTPLETLEYIIEDVDQVLIMTVDPGFMGQKLIPQTLRKIEKLRQMISDLKLNVKIEVDGNVNIGNVREMVAAGADILVGGSSGLFRSDVSLESAIQFLREDISRGIEKRGA